MVKQRLVPFINCHYKSGRYVIWPDLFWRLRITPEKSDHTLPEKKINFVPKAMNPAN
jgi:hypothetical protein